ncbi:carboxypeptidase-like regulatory domain-containing protein [Parabacteroides sp. GYB001]|uniref:carboxypeptidase-like regulatory domain-containing protein n=1 Tax=Parabacteroides leei TaxID=2939491 RepID=UPI002017CA49|nr:carboxypeptidase-like regulatory domain-containing protein [Parabacteroides leei]MCL3851997.1 carboxypeptidase-like regulatory domain-containing protein [Parabacteroides leei]
MENTKRCVWKRGGYLFIATLLSTGPFSSHVNAGTDHDQFNSATTELNNGLNQKKISRTIIDETGLPAIGANVVQKGTINEGITDINGRFSSEFPEDAVLKISYIGYLTQSRPAGSKYSLRITLREDTQKLDEVIVFGYGSTDATSTTVYMNAGNGVVVVTTKQGKTRKLSVNFQANFAFNTLSYPSERMDAYKYATAVNNLYQLLGNGVYSFRTPEEMLHLKILPISV